MVMTDVKFIILAVGARPAAFIGLSTVPLWLLEAILITPEIDGLHNELRYYGARSLVLPLMDLQEQEHIHSESTNNVWFRCQIRPTEIFLFKRTHFLGQELSRYSQGK